MTMIKIINAVSMAMGFLGTLLCANISAESFREGHVEHGVACAGCSIVCLSLAWWSSRIIEFCKEVEKENEDEAED